MRARVMPAASQRPSATSRSASTGSTIRDVATSGGPTRNGAVSAAIPFSGRGGGGTMPVEPRYVDEAPRATLT